MSETSDLSDDEFEAKIKDPSLIKTHEEALSILEDLDMNAADISAQIDAFRIEMVARVGEMPQERLAWLRRASYALAMRRNEREKIMKRDRELRGVYDMQAAIIGKASQKSVLKAARQATHTANAEAKKSSAEAHKMRIELNRSLDRLFVKVAKQLLQPDMYHAILELASAEHDALIIPSRPATTETEDAP